MFALFDLGMSEVVVLLALGLLLFGNRLPEMARSVGRGIRELKQGLSGFEDDLSKTLRG
jgi:sec-independent protein translocase protein TatA